MSDKRNMLLLVVGSAELQFTVVAGERVELLLKRGSSPARKQSAAGKHRGAVVERPCCKRLKNIEQMAGHIKERHLRKRATCAGMSAVSFKTRNAGFAVKPN